MSECVRVCHPHLSCARDVCEEGVILPDDVAGLGEAARHKEAFDDVDFLIHGLRQVGREIAIPRRGAQGDGMQKRKRGHQAAQNSNTLLQRGEKDTQTISNNKKRILQEQLKRILQREELLVRSREIASLL